MKATKYKPIVAYKQCENCSKSMPIQKYYEQKRFCSAKCRSLVVQMPPRPDQTGFVPWNKGLNKFTDVRIAKIAEDRTGEKNWQWKHGQSKTVKTMWSTSVYRDWRRAVFERDNYICQACFTRGKELNADHIKCFAHHPELRYELSNGRTLCIDCHKKTDNYGYHKKEQCT